MRPLIVLALATLAFAGCTAPVEQPSPLFGVCPQWMDGTPSEETLMSSRSTTFQANASKEHLGRDLPLDRFHVILSNVQADGVLELRATADDGRALRFTDHRDPAGTKTPTFIAVDDTSGTIELDVYLSDVAEGSTAMPSDIQLELTGQDGASGSVRLTVTPGYRVCGAPL